MLCTSFVSALAKLYEKRMSIRLVSTMCNNVLTLCNVSVGEVVGESVLSKCGKSYNEVELYLYVQSVSVATRELCETMWRSVL